MQIPAGSIIKSNATCDVLLRRRPLTTLVADFTSLRSHEAKAIHNNGGYVSHHVHNQMREHSAPQVYVNYSNITSIYWQSNWFADTAYNGGLVIAR